MASNLRRHIMMQAAGGGGDRLLYWWSGEDAPINGAWVDRVTQLPLSLDGSYSYANNEYSFIGNQSWAKILLSQANFDFGHHFYIEVDVDVKVGSPSNECAWFIDFGSVQTASKNIGFGLPSPGYANFIINWKMQGNNAPQCFISDILPRTSTSQYNTYRIRFGMQEYDQTSDELFLVYNDNTYVSTQKLPKVEYSNFFTGNNAGQGLAGACFFLSRGQNNSRWCSSIWRDIKIYNID